MGDVLRQNLSPLTELAHVGKNPAWTRRGVGCMAVTTMDPLIRGIVRDESLTRGLGDEEARMLVDWVVDWAELLAEAAQSDDDAQALLGRLSRRGKAIGRFVQLWTDDRTRGSAAQLAATERFAWPLPNHRLEAPDLMHHILTWENSHHPQ